MNRFGLVALTLSLLATMPARASAQCECDHEVPSSTRVVDGEALGVAPGDVVCLMAGESTGVVLENLRGTAAAPITVRACGERVIAGTSSVGLEVVGCEHVRATSGGDDGNLVVRGFSRGIYVRGGSSGVELDHLEIDGATFTGLDVRTAPMCDGTWARESFAMEGLHIHHNFIHDVGSAMYLGELACTAGIACGADRVYPHQILDVDVHDNVMERTGRTALKIACSPDALVHHNVVRDFGTRDESSENNGLETREGSTVLLFANVVIGGTGHGIFIKSEAPTWVYDNVVVDPAGHGIALTGRSREDHGYLVAHNTLVRPGGYGLLSWSAIGEGLATSNLVVAPGEGLSSFAPGWTEEANLRLDTVDEARFVDAAAHDYALALGSPAIDRGAPSDVELDFDGHVRDAMPDVGAFEYGAGPPPVDAGGPGLDAGASTPTADGASDLDAHVGADAGAAPPESVHSGGCAVLHRATTPRALLGWALVLLAASAASRATRRRQGWRRERQPLRR